MKKIEDMLSPGVQNMLSNPKETLLKLSFPMMLGILVLTFYQLIDALWVAGLGADALAAVGLFLPFFTIILAIGSGLGLGVNSSISRNIGKGDKKAASDSAMNTIALGFIVSIIIIVVSLPVLNEIFYFLGGDGVVAVMAVEYSGVMFVSSIFLIFVSIGNAILRSEGDVKRAVYGLLLGSALNIVLDPIFIYYLNLGVAGAAWATLISMAISSLLYLYWILIKKDIYLQLILKKFRFDKDILKDVISVGIPSIISQLSISISLFILNIIVLTIAGTDGVAIYTSAYRVMVVVLIPVVGIGLSVTTITGALFGAKKIKQLEVTYFYSIKIGILLEILTAVLIFVFASQISIIFTYSQDAAHLSSDIANFLRITAFFYVLTPIGTSTTAMFEGMGKGINSLTVVVVKNLFIQLPICYLFGIVLDYGLNGIAVSYVLATILSASITFIWGRITIKNMYKSTPSGT